MEQVLTEDPQILGTILNNAQDLCTLVFSIRPVLYRSQSLRPIMATALFWWLHRNDGHLHSILFLSLKKKNVTPVKKTFCMEICQRVGKRISFVLLCLVMKGRQIRYLYPVYICLL